MKRIRLLDELRGVTLVSMILFHAVWDLVFIFHINWKWFYSPIAYVWQQSICWVFIFLSGFCWSLGKRKLRRGIIVSAAGLVVSLVTELVMPDQRVRFGVLTLLGICMLVMIPLEKLLRNVSSVVGLAGSSLCFVLTRNMNDGYLGFEGMNILKLPEEWYHMGDVASLLGFTDTSFYSTDYFSVFPWIFLFVAGYFGYRTAVEKGFLEKMQTLHMPGKIWGIIGKQSLIIYMLHQPIIYLGLYLLTRMMLL